MADQPATRFEWSWLDEDGQLLRRYSRERHVEGWLIAREQPIDVAYAAGRDLLWRYDVRDGTLLAADAPAGEDTVSCHRRLGLMAWPFVFRSDPDSIAEALKLMNDAVLDVDEPGQMPRPERIEALIRHSITDTSRSVPLPYTPPAS